MPTLRRDGYTTYWVQTTFRQYEKMLSSKGQALVEEKGVAFTPPIFALALFHIYQRAFLEDLLKQSKILGKIYSERPFTEFAFMELVDLLRKDFVSWFRELVLHRDFTLPEYENLAKEFLFLEEIVQKQIQIPLLDHFKRLLIGLEEAIKTQKSLSEADWQKFIRLASFFFLKEFYQPSRSLELLNRGKEAIQQYPQYEPNLKIIFSPEPKEREEIIKNFKALLYQKLKSLVEYIEHGSSSEGS